MIELFALHVSVKMLENVYVDTFSYLNKNITSFASIVSETKTIFKDLKPVLDSNEEIHFRKINKLCKGK